MAACDCGYGTLWFGDIDPGLYRIAAALVSAYVAGDRAAFGELCEEAPKDLAKVMVLAIYAALCLVAEERGWSMAESVAIFCRSAEAMATEAEAAQWPPTRWPGSARSARRSPPRGERPRSPVSPIRSGVSAPRTRKARNG